MTNLELFAVFGVPALLLLIGGGAVLWVRYSDQDRRDTKPGRTG